MKLTEQQRDLLHATDGTWAFCGYSAHIRRVASSLERVGFGTIGENDCGPIIRITDAGRRALEQSQSQEGK